MAEPDTKISFLDRAVAAVSPVRALQRAIARDKLVQFGYDGAEPGIKRGGSGGRAKNAGSETPKMARDRVELMWDARDLERNMPIVRCVLDRVVQYICETIVYQSQTGDADIDSVTEEYWMHWCKNVADVTGRYNFRMLIELGVRSALRDGDFGFHLIRNGGERQIQCIEADRIGDPDKVSVMTEEDYVQGIHLNALGQPLAYDIYRRERKNNRYVFDTKADAANFFLLSKPLRTDEYRSVSWLAPIIAPARDLYEMFSFERGAAKWAASIAGVITNSDPLAKAGAGSAGMWSGSKTADGVPSETVQGNRLLRLRANEQVTPFDTGSRPNGAFTAYIEAALRDIAMGLNVPFGFFDMSRFGGATVRLEAMQLDRTFGRHQEVLTSAVLDKVKREVLSNAIARDLIPGSKYFDYGRWQFGAHLTADTGYDTQANLDMLNAGLKSASAIAGEEGLDYEDLVDQLIKEATVLRDKCAEAGVPVEMVAMGRFPDASNQLAAAAEALAPAETTLVDLGDGAVKTMIDLLEKVAGGIIPREEAVALLIDIYELSPPVAEAIVPTPQPIAIEANKPAPAAKPIAPAKVDSPKKS